MIRRQFLLFMLRWLCSSFAMWLCISLFGNLSIPYDVWHFALIGLIFSLMNSVVKPFVTLLSLPLIIFSMGLFTVIINILIVWLTIKIMPGVSMNLLGAFFSAIVMSIINGLVNLFIPDYNKG